MVCLRGKGLIGTDLYIKLRTNISISVWIVVILNIVRLQFHVVKLCDFDNLF